MRSECDVSAVYKKSFPILDRYEEISVAMVKFAWALLCRLIAATWRSIITRLDSFNDTDLTCHDFASKPS